MMNKITKKSVSYQCTNFRVVLTQENGKDSYSITNDLKYDEWEGIEPLNETDALELCEALADLLGYKLVENHSV